MRLTILIAFLLCPFTALSQDFDSLSAEYEKFRNQAFKTYSDFREECNQKYCKFLKTSWEKYEAFQPLSSEFKDTDPPVRYHGNDEEADFQPIQYKSIIHKNVPAPQPEPISPVELHSVDGMKELSFSFYNTEETVRLPESRISLPSCNGDDIAAVWGILSDDNYDTVLADCLAIRENRNLCDWAYLQMIWNLASQYLGEGSDEATVMAAYIYSQSGYMMRLAESDGHLCLLYGSEHRIYGRPYYILDGKHYYPFNSDYVTLKICDFPFDKEMGMSLYIHELPLLAVEETACRQLKSERFSFIADISVNANLLAFYNTYPSSEINDDFMTGWALYAATPMDVNISSHLYPKFNAVLNGKSEEEAVAVLLDFVQTALEYDYDENVWGRERSFFAEESLFYPYCDCEDRAILFSRLVRDLIGLDVILVYYPGHLATAVRFNDDVNGDYIEFNKEKYIICDPTYIGAPIGAAMPDMDNTAVTVIAL